MGAQQKRTADEVNAAKTRFVVGSRKGAYVNGKSKMAMATLDITQAKKTIDYYDQMAMGETTAFELVPVIIGDDGSITRQT